MYWILLLLIEKSKSFKRLFSSLLFYTNDHFDLKMAIGKDVMIGVSVVFIFCTVAMISVGAVVLHLMYLSSSGKQFFPFAMGFIIVGVMALMMLILGILGTVKEEGRVLRIFVYFLALACMIKLGSGVAAIIIRDNIATSTISEIQRNHSIDVSDRNRVKFFDWLQERFNCCEKNGSQFEINSSNKADVICCSFQNTSKAIPGNTSQSFCLSNSVGMIVQTHTCSKIVKDAIMEGVNIISIIAVVLSVVQLLGVFQIIHSLLTQSGEVYIRNPFSSRNELINDAEWEDYL